MLKRMKYKLFKDYVLNKYNIILNIIKNLDNIRIYN